MQKGWIPVRVSSQDSHPVVDWCLQGGDRFTGDDFAQDVASLLHHPFHHLFRRQTPIEALSDWRRASPGIPPSGFIFHGSRCGADLVAHMLAALDRSIVLMEPQPVDAILRDGAPDEQRVEWLRSMISALGQPRCGEDRLFLVFDAPAICEFPIVRQAFPETPWIFLHGDPEQVLESQLRRRALWTIPDCAQILDRIYQLGLQYHREAGGLLLHSRQLPEAVFNELAQHFGLRWTAEEKARAIASDPRP